MGVTCSVTELALDDYEGTVDKAARTITVRVPETFLAHGRIVTIPLVLGPSR